MYVDQSRRLIFIHNPKTAGMSIVRSFGFPSTGVPNKFNHTRPKEAIVWIFQESWSNYYSFAFARNPWDRIVSLYYFQKSDAYGRLSGMSPSHQRAKSLDFNDWMDANIDTPFKSMWFGIPQAEWHAEVSEVFAFETLDQSLPRIAEIFGFQWDQSRENVTGHPAYRNVFTRPDHIDFIASLDRDTISRFGYDF